MVNWFEQTDQYFRGLDLWNLGVDEAYANVTSLITDQIFFYSLSEDCDKVIIK